MSTVISIALIAYLAPGFYLIVKSQSQGIIADLIFALAWPYFIWRHITKGY